MMFKEHIEIFNKELTQIVLNKLGDETTPILNYIDTATDILYLLTNEGKATSFTEEWCARGVHDARKNGLSVHTIKVFSELINMLFSGTSYGDRFYNNILNKVDMPALIIGCIIHDIGKTMEYYYGTNSDIHYCTHLLLGVEMLVGVKDLLIEKYGEQTYYRILSIIGQHHGEFGEKPQTIEAYLVHLADYQETKLQILEEAIDKRIMGNIISSEYIPFKLNVKVGDN